MKPPKVTSRIRIEDGNPILKIELEHMMEISFTIWKFPEDSHEWLVKVLTRQVREAVHRSYRKGVSDVRKATAQALGLAE